VRIPTRKGLRAPALGITLAATLAASAGLAGMAAAAPSRITLAGSTPSWAQAGRRVGATSGSNHLEFRVYLNNRTSAAAFATAVSTPGNKLYGKFLTPAQYRARFSPTSAQSDQVSSWLRSQGLKVVYVPANHKFVEASGSVAQAAKAFKTSFAEYRYAGTTLRSNTSPLTVPGSLSMVQGVVGLDESELLVRHDAAVPPSPGFRNAPPCSRYWGEHTLATDPAPHGYDVSATDVPNGIDTYAPCGYAGSQLQGAYGMSGPIAAGKDGRGVTVAVIDAYASPTILQDANRYFRRHDLPEFTDGQFTQVVAPGTYRRAANKRQDPQGWWGEETLDVEAVHTMAPGAKVVYVGAPNNFQDLDAAMNHVVDQHLASIVTNSYGWSTEALPKGFIKPVEDTFVQAAAEGISLFFSSGDNADETDGVAGATPTPDWPASSPWVTAVGGTAMGVGASNERVFELGWESRTSTLDQKTGTWPPLKWAYGGGGGTSRLFPQPSYQKGVVPDSIATYGGTRPAGRVVPDVAALGDPNTGMLVGQTQSWSDGDYYDEYRIGGTSLASPLYAGMFALAAQTHGEYGLANPALYATRATSLDITKAELASYPGVLRVNYVNAENGDDGYSYVARTFDDDADLTIHVRDGYDDVTGVGTPDGPAWLTAVSNAD
jgi:subtilase family serine protease